MIATLPSELIPSDMSGDDYTAFIADVQVLWAELVNEYFDPAFQRRTHGSHKTYHSGCQGPHCTVSNRQMARKNRLTEPSRHSKTFEPITIYLAERIVETREKALISAQELLETQAFRQ